MDRTRRYCESGPATSTRSSTNPNGEALPTRWRIGCFLADDPRLALAACLFEERKGRDAEDGIGTKGRTSAALPSNDRSATIGRRKRQEDSGDDVDQVV